jgi:GAF domain-containing protein
MKRPYYRKPELSSKGGSIAESSGMRELRLRILNVLLMITSVFGLLAVVINLQADIPAKRWGLIGVYVGIYLWVVVITIFRKIPYHVRTISFILVNFLMGISTLPDGINSSSWIWFLGSSALSAILLGLAPWAVAISLCLISLVGGGYLFSRKILSLTDVSQLSNSLVFGDWIARTVLWLLVALMVSVAAILLVRGLITVLEKERSMRGILAAEREQLDRRTRELDRRLMQIRTAAEVSREMSGLMDPKVLLPHVVELIRERFSLYYVGVFLLDEKEENAVLRAGTGEAGEMMIAQGHKLLVGGTSMIGWTIANRKPRIALDVGREAVRFNNPLLPKTRSEMALPLISGEQVIGALTVQSVEPEAFDEDDITVMQGIADSLAISLQNARLFEQTQASLAEIQALNRQYLLDTWKKGSQTVGVQRVVYENEAFIGSENNLVAQQFPLVLRDQVIGTLNLELESRNLTEEEQTFIREVTTQAALALENIRLLEESQQRASSERLLSDVVQRVRSHTDVDSILRSTIDELGKSLGASDGMIYIAPRSISSEPANVS